MALAQKNTISKTDYLRYFQKAKKRCSKTTRNLNDGTTPYICGVRILLSRRLASVSWMHFFIR